MIGRASLSASLATMVLYFNACGGHATSSQDGGGSVATGGSNAAIAGSESSSAGDRGLGGTGGGSGASKGVGGVGENGGASVNTAGGSVIGGAGVSGVAGSSAGTGSQETCTTDSDCASSQCASCVNSPGGCPVGNCEQGFCFYPSCTSVDACAGKSCGDACQACYDPDADCTSGVCDPWGDCKATAECSVGASRPCISSDAKGVGFVNGKTCNTVQGWGWDGAKCYAVIGCECQGSDCRSLLQTETDCSGAFTQCNK